MDYSGGCTVKANQVQKVAAPAEELQPETQAEQVERRLVERQQVDRRQTRVALAMAGRELETPLRWQPRRNGSRRARRRPRLSLKSS